MRVEGRDLAALPKAHLHLHLVGGMRRSTLQLLAERHGLTLPADLLAGPDLRATAETGWRRFERLYAAARSVLRTPEDLAHLLTEIVEDERAAGSAWVELQVDPTAFRGAFGGLVPAAELLVALAAQAARGSAVGVGLVVTANRTHHPAQAAALARLAVRLAGQADPVAPVVGFGLAGDEQARPAADYAQAFRIARAGGLLALPHGGELCGPTSVRDCLDALGARRIGHGVRAVEDPTLPGELAARGVVLEVCPSSNVALGVARELAAVPLRALLAAGVPVALGADDPLLFGAGLVEQYEIARAVHRLSDGELAALARTSVRASAAPAELRGSLERGIGAWLAAGSPPRASPGPLSR